MPTLARPAVHRFGADLAGCRGEGEVGNDLLIGTAQKLAAVVADSVDSGHPVLNGVTLRAFPGHFCLLTMTPPFAFSPCSGRTQVARTR
jgi:hypothetical protein